jgi:hypothetical protein
MLNETRRTLNEEKKVFFILEGNGAIANVYIITSANAFFTTWVSCI